LGAGLAAKAGAAISAAARMITGVDRDMEPFPSELPVSAEGGEHVARRLTRWWHGHDKSVIRPP
jgi:hypothetical protein